MLERIREGSQGVTAKVILTLVILSFALAGIGSYLGQTTEQPIATVNGKEISQLSFARAYENERARLEQQFGEYFSQIASDPSYMAQLRQSVVDRLVQQELQNQLASELGLRVSDEALKEEIRNISYFQVGGQFNNDRYLQVIRQMNYSPDSFRDYLRAEMTRNQLVGALTATDFTLDNELAAVTKLENQLRDADVLTITAEQFKSQVTISDEQRNDYYTLNQAKFMAPEQISLEYLEFKAADLALSTPISDADIAANYDENKALYLEPERRRVSHILIENLEDDAAAKAKADSILMELKGGAEFAKVASEKSDDVVSAELGGDLEWIDRDMMDPAFEEAAFALAAKGDISEVVQSEFGYHIIQLTDLVTEQTKPLADVKEEIKEKLAMEQKLDQYYELQTEVTDLAFEVADSLAEAAEAAGVEVKSTALFSRNNAPAPVNNPKVLTAAFSAELLEDGVNSELIELGNEHIIFVRVKEHVAAAVKPLEEVSASITTTLTNEKAGELAKEKADALYEKVTAGESLATLAEAEGLTVAPATGMTRKGFTPSYEVVQATFKLAKPTDKPVTKLVTLNNGDASIIALNKVYDAPEKALDEQAKQSIARQQIGKSFTAFVEALKANADINSAAVAPVESEL